MQAYIREKLIKELVYSQKLANAYQAKNTYFIGSVLSWIEALETEFSKLRHPLAGVLSRERLRLLSVVDGNIDPQVKSKNKERNFQAIAATEVIGRELQQTIHDIDEKFSVWKDKIAQLAAISSRQHPILIHNINEINNQTLKQIWVTFGKSPEGFNMHQYLSAVMPQADLLYLLHDIIANLLANQE